MLRRFTLALLGLVAIPATGQSQALEDYDYENLSFRGIGLDIGYLWPTKVEPTERYGLRLDLGFLGPGVRIIPSIGYWSSELKARELDRLADQLNRLDALRQEGVTVAAEELGSIEWSDVSLNLDGQYAWDTNVGIMTFVGLGVGIHALNGRGDAIKDTFVEDLLDSITAGVSALAGLEVEPVDRLRLYVEGRYSVLSDLRYPEVKFGAALMLPAAQVMGSRR